MQPSRHRTRSPGSAIGTACARRAPAGTTVVALALAIATTTAAGDLDGVWTAVPPPNGRLVPGLAVDAASNRLLAFGGSDGVARGDLWALDLATGTWSELAPAGDTPPPRWGHSVVHDPVTQRLLVFGGTDDSPFNQEPQLLNDVHALALDGSLAWSEIEPAGAPPAARSGQTVIHDASRGRLLLFGGDSGELRNDVWELDLSGTPVWNQLAPLGTPPTPRQAHVAVLDGADDRMLVFGGATDQGLSDELWALELSGALTWTELEPPGLEPGRRRGAAAALDAARDRWLVLGGFDGDDLRNDVWAFALDGGAAWNELAPPGPAPSARQGHRAVLDPTGDRLLVLGGNDGAFALPTTVTALALDGEPEWSTVPTPPAPGSRMSHTAITDPLRDRMLLLGGFGGDPGAGTWSLSLGDGNWNLVATQGEPPSNRLDHAAVHDPLRDRMLVFGGSTGTLTDAVWGLTLDGTPVWNRIEPAGTPPSARLSHTAIYDPVRDRMLVFGGRDGVLRNDVWELSLAGDLEWRELLPSGLPPEPRRDHTAIYDPVRDRMIVYGGNPGFAPVLNDVWALELSDPPAWSELVPDGPSPEGPLTHAALYDPVRDRLVAFAGSYHHDVWALSLAADPAWTQLEPDGMPPTGRVDHTVVYDAAGDRLVAFGGHSGLTLLGDTWLLAWGSSTSAGPGTAPEPTLRLAAYPNPARTGVTFRFELPPGTSPGRPAVLSIYDVRGRAVGTLTPASAGPAGTQLARWDLTDTHGSPLPSGIYFYALRAGGETLAARKILLAR